MDFKDCRLLLPRFLIHEIREEQVKGFINLKVICMKKAAAMAVPVQETTTGRALLDVHVNVYIYLTTSLTPSLIYVLLLGRLASDL